MLEPRRIPDLDRWLDELDQLVEEGAPSSQFYRRVLGQLRLLLAARGTAVAFPAVSSNSNSDSKSLDRLEIFAVDGTIDAEVLESISVEAVPPFDPSRPRSSVAVPIRKKNSRRGWLLASFDHEVPPAAASVAHELMSGVAEAIAAHQRAVIEKFLDQDWSRFQIVLGMLRRTQSIPEAAFVLVNELQPLFKAARVSLVEQPTTQRNPETWRGAVVLAVSGVEQIDERSPIIIQIKKDVASVAQIDEEPQVELSEGLSLHRITIPLEEDPRAATFEKSHSARQIEVLDSKFRSKHTLVIEWKDVDRETDAKPLVLQFALTLAEAWQQQARWLALPALARRYAGRSLEMSSRSASIRRWITGSLIVSATIALLFLPQPFRIRATGTLQPENQRSVFVSVDGIVEEVLVTDGQAVEADQPLLRVRSHLLDREMERIRGELAALREKRNGIKVALNEAAANANNRSHDPTTQAKLTTELRVLDVEEEGLKRQVALLSSEREKLIIRSPIKGFVVAHDLHKQLDQRPVTRGDLLFRVADTHGPWQLELRIAERDSSHVREHFFDQASPGTIDYALAADPKNHHPAKLKWMAPVAYRDAEDGVVVDARAAIDQSELDKRHMGGKIDATLMCGMQPIWFIWSRPLVEELQRRFWW